MSEPFHYAHYANPYAASIADLLLHQGDIRANAEMQQAALWGRAMQGIGDSVAGVANAVAQSHDPRVQIEQAQLAEIKGRQDAAKKLDTLMAGDQLPAGDVGPRQDSYLNADGLFDIPKLNAALSAQGAAHFAPELLKGAEAINDSVLKHQELQRQADQQHTILLGDMAHSAIGLMKMGAPIDVALDSVVAPGLATKRFAPQEYEQIKAKLTSLPPDQQIAALSSLVDAAAKLAPTKNLSEGAIEVDRYGRTVASGAPKAPTEAELAERAAKGDQVAIDAMNRLKPAPKLTTEEQELNAYAKTIGKPDRSALTYDDYQTFAKNKAAITSNQAFQQHMRERDYDVAHPIPEKVKSQDALEQEYRTVLARGLSSRSGGLGLEDAKVQQANHLLALMDQSFDPKTGAYNIPKVQYEELALGLARLVSPGGVVGEGMKNDLVQATAQGDLLKVATYLTGKPFNGSTQDVFKMLRDSIERQGGVAEQNREGEMRYLRGLAPTDLEEARRTALEANSLNPLRQSRIIQNTQTGERRIQTSTDGGKTWK